MMAGDLNAISSFPVEVLLGQSPATGFALLWGHRKVNVHKWQD